MELSGKKIAVLVDQLYQEMEVWYPLFRLQEAGAKVVTVGPVAGHTYPSKLGYPVKCDLSWEVAQSSDFDGVVIPGGYAPDHIRRHPKALEFVREIDQQGKLVASICHGPWVLSDAGLTRGKRATGWWSIKPDLENADATFIDEPAITDGKIVTARAPIDLAAFVYAIDDLLVAA